MTDERKAALDDACLILSRLSAKFTKANDDRRFGINVAFHAMCAFRDGKAKTVAEAVATCDPVPPPGERS